MSGISHLWLINQLPWTPVLSRKFASWKLLLLDARYCVNRWNIVECFYKSKGFVYILVGTTYLIPIAHEVMYRYEALVHNHPVGVEGPLYQEVSQGRDRDIGLVCTLKQIWKHDDIVITLFDLASLGTYSQDVSSSVRWSPQWLPCTPPWPGPDLPDCVAPPGSCHWESVLLESASWPEIGDIWASSLIWNWTLIAWWWQGEGSTGSGAIFCVVCVNCVMGLCAAWSLLLTRPLAGELS